VWNFGKKIWRWCVIKSAFIAQPLAATKNRLQKFYSCGILYQKLRRHLLYQRINQVEVPTEVQVIPGLIGHREGSFLFILAKQVPPNGVIVEIGSYFGSSTGYIASALAPERNIRFYAVDTWKNDAMSEGRRDTFSEFLENIKSYRNQVVPLRGCSLDIVRRLDVEIDLLFVDADHSYEAVKSDILSWCPLVKMGGWVAFHDYTNPCGIAQAVSELLAEHCSAPILVGSIWAAPVTKLFGRD